MSARLYDEGLEKLAAKRDRAERAKQVRAELEAATLQASPTINCGSLPAASTMGDFMQSWDAVRQRKLLKMREAKDRATAAATGGPVLEAKEANAKLLRGYRPPSEAWKENAAKYRASRERTEEEPDHQPWINRKSRAMCSRGPESVVARLYPTPRPADAPETPREPEPKRSPSAWSVANSHAVDALYLKGVAKQRRRQKPPPRGHSFTPDVDARSREIAGQLPPRRPLHEARQPAVTEEAAPRLAKGRPEAVQRFLERTRLHTEITKQRQEVAADLHVCSEMDECTFRPAINKQPLGTRESLYARGIARRGEKAALAVAAAQQRDAEELSECTFRPAVVSSRAFHPPARSTQSAGVQPQDLSLTALEGEVQHLLEEWRVR